MSSGRSDRVVLNYHDSIIYESDVQLLSGPFWLNDTIIGFYLEYIEEEIYGNTKLCFVRPEVTQCLKLSPVSELSVFLDPLKFRCKDFALLPLNDCDDPSSAGGSHWSLLVYSRPDSCFYHIDSSQGSKNSVHARHLASKLGLYLYDRPHIEFRTLNSVQQSNSYDCGVFVLCNIDSVAKHAVRYNQLADVDLFKDNQVYRKRRDLKTLIENLARAS